MRKIMLGGNLPHGQRKYRPGIYRVPADMPPAVADLAVRKGLAAEIAPVPGVDRPDMAAAGEAEFLRTQGDPEAESRRKRRRKGPENKALSAREDKADGGMRDDPAALD